MEAAIPSAMESPKRIVPSAIAIGIDEIGDVPGLQSLASAIATPASTIARAGGTFSVGTKKQLPGMSTATVAAPPSAATPACETCPR